MAPSVSVLTGFDCTGNIIPNLEHQERQKWFLFGKVRLSADAVELIMIPAATQIRTLSKTFCLKFSLRFSDNKANKVTRYRL